MSVVRWIIGVVIFLAVLLLSFANAEQVTLHFFGFGNWQAPLIFVVFCAFALGVTFGLLAGAIRVVRVKRELRKVRKVLLAHEKEKEQAANTSPASASSPDPASAPPAPPAL